MIDRQNTALHSEEFQKQKERKHQQQAALRTNNIIRLNWSQMRRQLSLLFVGSVLIIISISSSSNLVQAEHALSEVWSESDGMQMKYSTDHEDLLSTKGSELQLNIHGKPNEAATIGANEESAAAATSGGAGNQEGSSSSSDSGNESSGGLSQGSGDHSSDGTSGRSNSIPTSSGNGEDSESSSNNEESPERDSSSSGEESPDSTSSPTNRVPLSKQHSSGNNLRSREQTRFNEPSARFRTNQHDQLSSINGHDEDARATRFKPESDYTNFNSIPSGGGQSSYGNGDDSGNQESVDQPDLPSQASHETATGKAFRQVGKMFKEAIKMNSGPAEKAGTKSKGNLKSNEVNNENDDNEEENKNSASSVSEEEKQQQQQQQDDDAPLAGAQEPDYNQFKSSVGKSKMVSTRARQNMIDFDRMVDNKQGQPMVGNQQMALQQQAELGDEIANVDGGEEEQSLPVGGSSDGYRRSLAHHNRVMQNTAQFGRQQVQQLMNSPPDEFGMFQGNVQSSNNINSNPFFAAGSSPEKKERIAPGKQATTSGKQSNKPLAYFRSASQQQKQASEEARRGPIRQASQQQPESPDSVRDNFISPGHFPGSMPHLTQAASETQKKEAEIGMAPVAIEATQPVVAASTTTASAATTQATPVTKSDQSSSVVSAATTTIPKTGLPIDPTISVASTDFVSTSSLTNVESSQQRQLNKSDTNNSTIQPELTGPANRAEPSSTNESSKERDLQIHVTPVPESQPESQQIMAPVYFSTTTMAPLPASNGSGNVKTSETPTLKRFKFRKYRR